MFSNAQIAEALSVVLEINDDSTERVAYFGYGGNTKGLQIDVYPRGWSKKNQEYFISFADYADIDFLKASTYRGKRKTELKQYETFSEMLEAVKEAGL